MPTPPLPLLHQLLHVLHIPVHPPTISSISPSLLLLILESLLAQPLPLPHNIRQSSTPEGEISVVKCILGVLADDLNLGEGIIMINPKRVVEGGRMELEVLIMAFAVIAKRRGLSLKLPKVELQYEEDEGEWEEDSSGLGLQDPIEPDVSFTSTTPSKLTTTRRNNEVVDDDVFTVPLPTKPRIPTSTSGSGFESDSTRVNSSQTEMERERERKRLEHEADRHRHTHQSGSSASDFETINSSRSKSRTVLDEILEEFGT